MEALLSQSCELPSSQLPVAVPVVRTLTPAVAGAGWDIWVHSPREGVLSLTQGMQVPRQTPPNS